jgi:phosphatidylglycerol---prolipoprotein diacylglyceryl transferase
MHPIIFDLGKIELHSYGLMMFVAFIAAILIAHKRAKSRGFDENLVIDLSIAIIISGLAGGRILYILTHLHEFSGRWLDIVNPVQSNGSIGFAGFVLLGGVILSFITVAYISRKKNYNFLSILDLFTPSLAIGIAFGRVGCFLNGCCYGRPTDLPWGIVFPETSIAGSVFYHTHIHPTQIYAVLYASLLALLIIWAERKFSVFNGFSWSIFLVGYGFFRFLNELLRWHEESLRLIKFETGFITVSQTISLSMILAGILLFYYLRRRELNKEK